MMVVVAIVAIAMSAYEVYHLRIRTVNASSGRFLVVVKTFRGESARAQASDLAYDLRRRHKLPTYILSASDLPSRLRLPKLALAATKPANEQVLVVIGDCETNQEISARQAQLRRINTGTFFSRIFRASPLVITNPFIPQSVAASRPKPGVKDPAAPVDGEEPRSQQ
ncbi:hypothetical protein [Singulisphaera sp. PoT]|uniref:hypothetical protein n=1 Tax=Singulisphaera sp. PoT TaxID=3411797 RepID=UPI003BF48036